MNCQDSIVIDGSHGEGGGQIVRTALAFSTLSRRILEVHSIRKGRSQPGMKNQLVYCVEAMKKICNAETKGDYLGSLELNYMPNEIFGGEINIDVKSAAALTLLLQCLVLPLCFAENETRIKMTGGTDVPSSPSFDCYTNTILPMFLRYADIQIRMIKRGFFPAGSGEIEALISPKYKLSAFNSFITFKNLINKNSMPVIFCKKGVLKALNASINCANKLKKEKILERLSDTIINSFETSGYENLNLINEYTESSSPGFVITLWATFQNQDSPEDITLQVHHVSKKDTIPEVLARTAVNELIALIESESAVDSFLADNIIPLLALSGGKIKVSEITEHTYTNIYYIEKFTDTKFKIDNNIISI